MTEKSYILEISFARVHFFKAQNREKIPQRRRQEKIEGTVLM
jgi:hypothetical protein